MEHLFKRYGLSILVGLFIFFTVYSVSSAQIVQQIPVGQMCSSDSHLTETQPDFVVTQSGLY